MSTDVFVDFRDAAFTYDGEAFVFRHLNLTVPQGQFLCLLGGNGSGKSTLAKHINALLLPDEGEVVVFGCDTRDAEQTYFIRSNAGLVFQNPTTSWWRASSRTTSPSARRTSVSRTPSCASG